MPGYSEASLLSPDIAKLCECVDHAVDEVAVRLNQEHRAKGGWFQAFKFEPPDQGFASLRPFCDHWAGGEANRGKLPKYRVFAFEKAFRLAENRALGHVSSRESRLEGTSRFDGAIFFECMSPVLATTHSFIFSFSGLPEEADEAVAVLTAFYLRDYWPVSIENLLHILKISQNKILLAGALENY